MKQSYRYAQLGVVFYSDGSTQSESHLLCAAPSRIADQQYSALGQIASDVTQTAGDTRLAAQSIVIWRTHTTGSVAHTDHCGLQNLRRF